MTRRRSMLLILVLALTLAPGRASRADEGSFQVIVHPDNPISSIDRDLLRRAYLKKVRDWGHGPTIRPIDLPHGAVRDRFTREVLKKSRSQLKNYWTQQIFSGKGVPPPTAKTIEDAIAYVLANPGAVAYLPADVDAGDAKVVRLD